MAPQYAYPDADVSVGAWTTDDGSSDRFAAINEAPTDDSDYISVTDDTSDTSFPITFSLSSVTDPSSGADHSVVVRAYMEMADGSQNLNVHLKDGSTSIKNEDFTIQDSLTNHTMDLSTAQANNISGSGYGNLTLILTSYDASMSGGETIVTQAYFACPGASGGGSSAKIPITLFINGMST